MSLSQDPPLVNGALEERRRFAELQAKLPAMYERIFPDRMAVRTVLVIPSLSLDPEELVKVAGVHHYEERMLCLLMMLRQPRCRVVYVTSSPVDPATIDYYLHLLPGIPTSHARRRLELFHCEDSSMRPLSQKILERPRLLQRIQTALGDPEQGHMACFNATPLERSLSVRLGIPLYACDPALSDLGSKTGSRRIFKAAGIELAPGYEDLRDTSDMVDALVRVKQEDPQLRRAVVKLNEGFSGEGNALFRYDGAPSNGSLRDWVRRELPRRLQFEAARETWDRFEQKFETMRGVVEAMVDGADKRSPSAQLQINPLGTPEIISTHDQVLGGPSGQIFLGCRFPADAEYRLGIQRAGLKVAEQLAEHGVLGRFGVDFVSVRDPDGSYRHVAIEINLRKGGTTHPFVMLQYLTDGKYDAETGLFRAPNQAPRYYRASDNLEHARYRGLLPEDLVDMAVCHNIHFHGATQTGVVFHLLGALSEFGKFGLVCIAGSAEGADALYDQTVDVLTREADS